MNCSGQVAGRPTLRGSRPAASVKGRATLIVQISHETIAVTDSRKHIMESLNVAGEAIALNHFERSGDTLVFDVQRPNAAPININGVGLLPPVELSFIDSTGRRIWSTKVDGGTSGSASTNGGIGPFKLEISAPTKTKEMVVPFEMKDLPLPLERSVPLHRRDRPLPPEVPRHAPPPSEF